jgi:hypothetical protein
LRLRVTHRTAQHEHTGSDIPRTGRNSPQDHCLAQLPPDVSCYRSVTENNDLATGKVVAAEGLNISST